VSGRTADALGRERRLALRDLAQALQRLLHPRAEVGPAVDHPVEVARPAVAAGE